MKTVWKWLKRLWLLIPVGLAALYFSRARGHRKVQKKLDEAAGQQEIIEENKEKAKVSRRKAAAAGSRAQASYEEGMAKVEELENTDESMADLARRINSRVRKQS